MELKRENFMETAGDAFFEINEMHSEEMNEVLAPDYTASTPLFSLFCC